MCALALHLSIQDTLICPYCVCIRMWCHCIKHEAEYYITPRPFYVYTCIFLLFLIQLVCFAHISKMSWVRIPPETVHFSLKKDRWTVSGVVVLCCVCHLYTFLISSNIHVVYIVHQNGSKLKPETTHFSKNLYLSFTNCCMCVCVCVCVCVCHSSLVTQVSSGVL